MSPKRIAQKYNRRATAIAERVARGIEEAGYFSSGVGFENGDEYRWSVVVRPHSAPVMSKRCVDVSILLCTSEDHDGEQFGVNFLFNVVTYDGEVLASFAPFNYTRQCWVDRRDEDAVDERFSLFEQQAFEDVVVMIGKYWQTQVQEGAENG